VELGAGDVFGRYTILALIGKGGSGRVYRARDEQLQREVALKVLEETSEGSPDASRRRTARILREARAAAAIQHDHAVAIFDVGEIGGQPFITMELVDGVSLRKHVGDAAIPIEQRLKWLAQVASALQAAHDRRIVHRDVKPENVMVRRDGAIKVLDFGIARPEAERGREEDDDEHLAGAGVREAVSQSGATTEATWAGTPRYMSPEQLRRDPIDARSDQFSWGVLAYELLTGRRPWPGDAPSLSTIAVVCEQEIDVAALDAACPARVAKVVRRTLAKEPEDRFDSMRDVIDALGGPLHSGGRWWRRAGAVAFALVGVATAATFVAWRGRAVPPTAAVDPASAAGAAPATGSDAVKKPRPNATEVAFPMVALVLDATKGVTRNGSTVVRWEDQSGVGNHALAGSPAPTFVASAIHGLPALHFERGQHMTIADASGLQAHTFDFVVEVVARHDRPLAKGIASGAGLATAYGMLFGKTEIPAPYRGIALLVNYPDPVPGTRLGVQTSMANYVVSTTDGLNDGKPHLFGARRRNATLEVRLDGVGQDHIDTASDDVSAVGRPIFLGAQESKDNGIIQQLQGDIAEVVVVMGDFGDDGLRDLEHELMTKFGL
jgi:serine/threonine-protein kinase